MPQAHYLSRLVAKRHGNSPQAKGQLFIDDGISITAVSTAQDFVRQLRVGLSARGPFLIEALI